MERSEAGALIAVATIIVALIGVNFAIWTDRALLIVVNCMFLIWGVVELCWQIGVFG